MPGPGFAVSGGGAINAAQEGEGCGVGGLLRLQNAWVFNSIRQNCQWCNGQLIYYVKKSIVEQTEVLRSRINAKVDNHFKADRYVANIDFYAIFTST
jgi:hypothetical protein